MGICGILTIRAKHVAHSSDFDGMRTLMLAVVLSAPAHAAELEVEFEGWIDLETGTFASEEDCARDVVDCRGMDAEVVFAADRDPNLFLEFRRVVHIAHSDAPLMRLNTDSAVGLRDWDSAFGFFTQTLVVTSDERTYGLELVRTTDNGAVLRYQAF